jgi:hypothetical protein
MPHAFRLFWLRETGCDAGTLLRADQLVPEIREHVLALVTEPEGETILRLPFFDLRDWKRRRKILPRLRWERHGNEISSIMDGTAALRDLAANLVLTHPAWTGAPLASDPDYFQVWQSVCMNLQKSMRAWTSEVYFEDAARFEDRATAYPILIYESARVCHGKPRMDFTYDLRDYPKCILTLTRVLRLTGRAQQAILARVEQRLQEAGNPVLARRYSPVWYQDIVRQVRRKPRRLVELLAHECVFINALIDLGSNRTVEGVNIFSNAAGQSLRNMYGMDLRGMGLRALNLTTEILRSARDGAARDAMFEETVSTERVA